MAEEFAPIGLALVRPAEIMGAEPYFHELIAGIERVTLPLGYPVLLRVLSSHASELTTYEEWARHGRVSAVLIVDLLGDDPRPAHVEELGLPAVIIGPPGSDTVTTVWTDDDEAMRDAVRRFAALGHANLLHVGGPADLLHSERRRRAFVEECEALGIASVLLDLEDRPSAAIFDSDLMALGALDALQASGRQAPADLSIMAWDDSALCQLADPPVSAVSRDTQADGQLIGSAVMRVLNGESPTLLHAAAASIVERESSGPPVTHP